MSYQVLARKWRPRAFKDMIGQEHILRMLANALEQKRIHHAYLFTGTRGVGKTTIARILAKCLNCETNMTATPCGTCPTCRAIDAGQFLDLYEVDAASRTKVEDTRELLDNVLYPPTQGRYKVYLIDEVHMLSNHSFNALLKTLEEPPEHVKFLLATTDPKKLPVTILSRCLQFHLKRITPEQITAHLEHICRAENIAYEVPALEKLAKAADGSMRDALSILDQAIAYGQGSVKKQEVHSMLGSMAQDDLVPLIESLALQDGKALFAKITHLTEQAPDYADVLEELISILHRIALAQIIPDTTSDESIRQLTQKITPEDVQLYYQIALLGRRDLAYSPSPQQGFEMVMLRMLAFNPGIQSQTSTAIPSTVNKPQTQSTATPAAQQTAKAVVTTGLADWRDMIPKLGLSGMTHALASNCTLEKIDGNKVTLVIAQNHAAMINTSSKERLTEALSRFMNQTVTVDFNITTSELVTPIKQQQVEHTNQLAIAKSTMLNDPKVKQLLEMYDATLDVSLVTT
jgi:DNA polymerase-3 subunit gamma/tau